MVGTAHLQQLPGFVYLPSLAVAVSFPSCFQTERKTCDVVTPFPGWLLCWQPVVSFPSVQGPMLCSGFLPAPGSFLSQELSRSCSLIPSVLAVVIFCPGSLLKKK